jgi:HSP20 family protein
MNPAFARTPLSRGSRVHAIDRLGLYADRLIPLASIDSPPASTRMSRVANCLVVKRWRTHMLLSDLGRIGFDPFLEMRRMQQEMNQRLGGMTTRATQEFPPINLWVGEDGVAVTAELPGVAPDNVDLTVRENTLTLKGQLGTEEEISGWHRRERSYGSFSRTIQLPFRVDPEQVQARFANGVLEVELHRPESDRPRKIQIRG